MYRIGVLAEEKMEGWEYEKKIREFCSGHGIDISGTENLLGSGNIFQTDPEIRADERVPCASWCGRPECGRASPVTVPTLWNYLVQ